MGRKGSEPREPLPVSEETQQRCRTVVGSCPKIYVFNGRLNADQHKAPSRCVVWCFSVTVDLTQQSKIHYKPIRTSPMLNLHITQLFFKFVFLWSPYVIRQTIIFSSCSFFLLSSSFFSSPNLSGGRLDVYHTSTHGVALVRI